MQKADFFEIKRRSKNKDSFVLYPEWKSERVKDLIFRGGTFYAVWKEESGLWSKDVFDAMDIVKASLYEKKAELEGAGYDGVIQVEDPSDFSNRVYYNFVGQYAKSMPNTKHYLDSKIIFADQTTKRTDYASFKLAYKMEDGDLSAYNEIMHTLYSDEELQKIEWAIGAIIAGEAIKSQKAVIFYGPGGSGKSTTLDLVKALFSNGDNQYYTIFNAKDLISGHDQFATSAFKDNPPIAIQDDGDLSRALDTTTFKSIISGKEIIINDKGMKRFKITPHSFCLLATNDPIDFPRLEDGLVRRLIIVTPTGAKIPPQKFRKLNHQMLTYELGAIAKHCYDYYMSLGDNRIDAYKNLLPTDMLDRSNDMYNFVADNYADFKRDDGVASSVAWNRWKEYCEQNFVKTGSRTTFKDKLSGYFDKVVHRPVLPDGTSPRDYYKGFKKDLFKDFVLDGSEKKQDPKPAVVETKPIDIPDWLVLTKQKSLFDDYAKDWPAQYSTADGIPKTAWANCNTKLIDISTGKEHYVQCPENIVVIDLDLKDADGNKSAELNLKEAAKFPKTYAEFSRGGAGVHLTYIYNGDTTKLAGLISENVEIKHAPKKGGSWALRRRLTKCNDIPITTLTSGLPIKETKENVLDFKGFENEKHLRSVIAKNLAQKIVDSHWQSIKLIKSDLDAAYASGMKYDVTDMRPDVIVCAGKSHHANEALSLIPEMKFKSEDVLEGVPYDIGEDDLVFFDVEVFPNLFVVCYKTKDHNCVKMINPSPDQIAALCKHKLVGFNNRKYDNHILYARMLGYSNEQLYEISQRLISKTKVKDNGTFSNAYNLSYTDIYDFAAAGNKKSLKKLEIEMGIHHQELGLPWDQPVDEALWNKVADYCCNDVEATEAAFNYLHGDFVAREMLAAITGGSVNDTTNQLTGRLIFGKEQHPQSEFVYTDLSTGKQYHYGETITMHQYYDDPKQASIDIASKYDPEHLIEETGSNNCFPGYIYQDGKSYYMGEEVGEGGYVYAEPGMYGWATTKDVASMHPHSLMALNLFGDRFTKIFADLVQARIDIKHKDYKLASTIFDGKLKPYLADAESAKGVASALKTAINSVYGLTSAKFENKFKDPANVDNIVAKRGALFMITLKHIVQSKGYTVIHIKTDSIKIKNPDKEILDYVIDFGHKYGYDFETEAEWDRLCLVNNAVFIGHQTDSSPGYDKVTNGWEAVGAQFAEPYVFKTLFTHQDIIPADLAQTKSCQTALYLDMNENLPEGEHAFKFIGRVGLFCPMKPGTGGGILLRSQGDKFNSVSGTKGYRWMEEEDVMKLGKQDDIDISFFETLADQAKSDINKYGDFDWFVSLDIVPPINSDELPF